MEPPFFKIDDRIIKDSNNSYAILDSGVREVLEHLREQDKQISFLSVGGRLDVEYEKQPTIMILKMFEIYSYFNDQKHLLYKTAKKDDILKKMAECVFFDDNEKHILEGLNLNNVSVVDRKSFAFWEQLL